MIDWFEEVKVDEILTHDLIGAVYPILPTFLVGVTFAREIAGDIGAPPLSIVVRLRFLSYQCTFSPPLD